MWRIWEGGCVRAAGFLGDTGTLKIRIKSLGISKYSLVGFFLRTRRVCKEVTMLGRLSKFGPLLGPPKAPKYLESRQ